MAKIIISGDSWSKSWYFNESINSRFIEKEKQNLFATDNSISSLKLLIEYAGFDVTDVAKPASSPNENLVFLENELDNTYDYIIYLQTSPARNLKGIDKPRPLGRGNARQDNINELLKAIEGPVYDFFKHMTVEEYEGFIDSELRSIYTKLYNITSKFDIPVLMIGGNSKLRPQLYEDYQNFHTVTESFIESAIRKQDVHHSDLTYCNWIKLMELYDCNHEMLKYVSSWNHKTDIILKNSRFKGISYPDSAHLNINGMFLLSNMILNYIDNL